jgi:hypothetical protein
MSYRKPYSSYFTYQGFDVNRYVNDILTECIKNNISDPEKCCIFNDVKSSHPDYNTVITRFTDIKNSELELTKCIKNNINKNDCIFYCKKPTGQYCFDYRLLEGFCMMFDRLKEESKK